MASEPQKLQFKPRARIIRTIGDQLISGPEAAVIELVKNAYDADASYVWIRFFPPLGEGQGRIVILDDGHGMTLTDIEQKWMEPATSSKVGTRRSPIKERIMMGSKGIGRFAAAKLGRRMALRSISDRTGTREEVLISDLDWSIFSGDKYLSEIEIDYLTQGTSISPGTEIEIREFNESWNETKLSKLHSELRRLISPLDEPDEKAPFRIYLDLSACTKSNCGVDGAGILGVKPDDEGIDETPPHPYEVQPFPLLTASDYEVSGSFDNDGNFTGTMEIRRAGQAPSPISELSVPLKDGELPCGKVEVHLYISDREADAVQKTMTRAGVENVSTAEARSILDEVAGVAIYRDGFRVRPYGDPENDWLTLDKRRVQNPSLRIGHDQVAGYVTVLDQEASGLVEKSSREGFEQNGAMMRLARLMEELLVKAVEPRRQDFRVNAGIARQRKTSFEEVRELSGLRAIRDAVSRLPSGEQEAVEKVIELHSAQLVEQISALQERQRVLEAKSSLGAIISEVLHEGAPAASYLYNASIKLQSLYSDLLAGGAKAESARENFPERLHNVKTNSHKLSELFRMLRPLSGGKRQQAVLFRPIDPVAGAIALFETRETVIETSGGFDAPEIRGHPDDLLTAMVNLIGNSVYWLEDAKIAEPKIQISLFVEKSEVVIYVEDNGPGIPREFAERIFEVGFTLRADGTGLGLNIAREALARSEGRLAYHLNFKGGTRFEIRFPLPGKVR